MTVIPPTQRAAVYYRNADVRIQERPVPKIGPGEVLVKILASGICGSDVLEWYRIKKAPIVLGHEIAGEIVALGEGVKKYQVGLRVAVSHHVPCNTCHYCLAGYHTACETLHTTNFDPGGFCQYVRVPAIQTDRGVFPLPDHVTFEEGSFVEPLACVVRGQRSAALRPGQTVAVLGSGISGILHIALAKALGAGRIIATDISEFRLGLARRFGADAAFDARGDVPRLVREANGGRPADLVIVCAGALAPFKQALASVDRGGTVLCFATTDPGVELPVPLNEFWRNDVTLKPSYGNSPYDATVALELIAARRVPVADMITHRLVLDETPRGFQLMSTPGGEHLKVVVLPHG
ncbi:MAG: alcohol dehydrogenase catalytic domain-containing protein [Planctomycetota bacterium]|nr:alcohol dehydrogenase catalytic domain-containing protein [Planctomycetota bacterium]